MAKIVGLNLAIAIIMLNVNGLNINLKMDVDWKTKTPICIKTQICLKRWKQIHYINIKHTKAEVFISITDITGFMSRNINRDTMGCFITIKG